METRAQVVALLRQRVRVRRLELQYCEHCVEAALYLVWAHVHVYLRASVVVSNGNDTSELVLSFCRIDGIFYLFIDGPEHKIL